MSANGPYPGECQHGLMWSMCAVCRTEPADVNERVREAYEASTPDSVRGVPCPSYADFLAELEARGLRIVPVVNESSPAWVGEKLQIPRTMADHMKENGVWDDDRHQIVQRLPEAKDDAAGDEGHCGVDPFEHEKPTGSVERELRALLAAKEAEIALLKSELESVRAKAFRVSTVAYGQRDDIAVRDTLIETLIKATECAYYADTAFEHMRAITLQKTAIEAIAKHRSG